MQKTPLQQIVQSIDSIIMDKTLDETISEDRAFVFSTMRETYATIQKFAKDLQSANVEKDFAKANYIAGAQAVTAILNSNGIPHSQGKADTTKQVQLLFESFDTHYKQNYEGYEKK